MDWMRATDRMWGLLPRLMALHTAAYRRTNGRIGHKHPGTPPMLLLDHVGARTGAHRTSPLVYVRDGTDYVIVASKGGYAHNPAWLYNLRANPDTTIQVGARRLEVRARVATDDERVRLWPKALKTYRGYRGYQERTARTIPLVILSPRAA